MHPDIMFKCHYNKLYIAVDILKNGAFWLYGYFD